MRITDLITNKSSTITNSRSYSYVYPQDETLPFNRD